MQSVNQVRQFYATAGSSTASTVVKSTLSESDALGSVCVKSVKSPQGDAKAIIVQHIGHGGMTSSDIINASQVMSAKATKASDLVKPLKQAVLVLDSSVNSGAPVAGQGYIVDIQVSNYICEAEESVLVKFGAAQATTGMTASDLYLALAKSFARNLSRDVNKFFKIYLTEEASAQGSVNTTWQEVTITSANVASSAFTGIIISELPQTADYIVGEIPVKTVNFKVLPHTILSVGDEVKPFTVESDGSVKLVDKVAASSTDVVAIKDGYKVADLEWFCMGERGDQIRQIGYPRTIRTKYMIDPTKEYDILDIAFFYQGRGVNVQKSEKMLTIAVPVGESGHEHDVIDAIISAINTALGTSINTLTVSTSDTSSSTEGVS